MDQFPDDGEEIVDLVVEPDVAGRRLDAYLAATIAELSRSRLKVLIEAGHVSIGGVTIVEAKKSVNAGDVIRVAVPPAVDPEPEGEPIPLNVVDRKSVV